MTLLSNAVKFTPAGGSVTVSARQMHHQVAITVADTGVGIPEEHRKAIFNRFHQLGVTTSGAREGTGLGLAITKSLVEQMGGRIRVESEKSRQPVYVYSRREPLSRAGSHQGPGGGGSSDGGGTRSRLSAARGL